MINCINHNNKEYKDLLKATGLDEMTLDLNIYNYQEDNKTDEFPSLDYFNLERDSSFSILDNAQNLLNKLKSEDAVIQNSSLLNGVYVNENNKSKNIKLVKENITDYKPIFIKDEIGIQVKLKPLTDKINRDDRIISSTMFQNIIENMGGLIPGLKVIGLSNETFIEFANENGINETYNSPTFILGDEIYYNSEATYLTQEMAIEETLHPVVYSIFKSDKTMFNSLFEDAKNNYPKLWSEIKNSYKQNQSIELVTQALSREFGDIYNSKFNKSLIHKILEYITDLFGKLFNYKSVNISNNHPKSLRDIVEDLNTKGNDLIPAFNYDSPYQHISSDLQINKSNYKDYVNKRVNQLRDSLEYRRSNITKGVKRNLITINETSNLIRNTNDINLERELDRINIDRINTSDENIEILKGEIAIARFLETMNSEIDKILGHLVNLNRNIQTGVSLNAYNIDELNDLKTNFIDWFELAIDNMFDAQITDGINYLGEYFKIVDKILDDNDKINKNTIKDFDTLSKVQRDIEYKFARVKSLFDNVRLVILRKTITEDLTEMNTPQHIIDLVNEELRSVDYDSSYLMKVLGSVNYAKDNALRLMGYYVTTADGVVSQKVLNKFKDIDESLEKLRKRKKSLYHLDKMLSEYDDNGNKTGNFISSLNYGMAEKNFNKELDLLLNKYGISDRTEINTENFKGDRKQFLLEENKIISKHYERRFHNDYYDAYAELSKEAVDAKADIDEQINNLLEAVTDKNGVIHTENLNEKQARIYENLRRDRRNLSIIYDEYGNEKVGIEREIAESIRNFNKKLQDFYNKKSLKHNKEWKDKLDQLKKAAEHSEDGKKVLKNWELSNVKTVFSDEFWDQMEKVERRDYGPEYSALQEQKNEILKIYKNTYDNEVSVNEGMGRKKSEGLIPMTDEAKELVKSIDKRLAVIRNEKRVFSKNQDVRFSDIAEILTTDEYKREYSLAKLNPDNFSDWFNKNHYQTKAPNGNLEWVPYSYWTTIKPKNKKYIINEPSNLWEDASNNSGLLNLNFDENQSVRGRIPKRSLYDNSKNFKNVLEDKDLLELYQKLTQTMKDSMDLIGINPRINSIFLPQRTGKFMTKFKAGYKRRGSGSFSVLRGIIKGMSTVVKDSMLLNEDDPGFNYEKQSAIDSRFKSDMSSKYVPKYYTRKLDDPNMLDKDIVSSVLEYYRMALNNNEKVKILPKLNMLLEQIGGRSAPKKTPTKNKFVDYDNRKNEALTSNTYEKAKSFVRDQVFNERMQFNIKLKGNKKLSLVKPLQSFRSWSVATNLAWKPIAFIADFVSAETDLITESMVGRYFDKKALLSAVNETKKSIIPWLKDGGKTRKSNKLINLMMLNEMAYEGREVMSDIYLSGNKLSKLRALKQNLLFFGWNTSDYLVRSHVTAAVYINNKLIDGKIIDKQTFLQKYYPDNKKEGENVWKTSGKTLYDVFKIINNELVITDPNFEKAYTQDIKDSIRGILHKVTTEIDGQIRETDKSSLHTNALGSFFVMHRGFILANIFKQLKPHQYDFFSRREEYGNFRASALYGWNTFPERYKLLKSIGSGLATGNIEKVKESAKQLREIKNNLDVYSSHSRKYTIRAIQFMMLYGILSSIINKAADDDKNDDLKQYMALQMSRIMFENSSKASPFEVAGILSNPTAAMGLIDNLTSLDDWFDPKPLRSGIYKGMSKRKRNLIKATPFKNLYETAPFLRSIPGIESKEKSNATLYRQRNKLLYKNSMLNLGTSGISDAYEYFFGNDGRKQILEDEFDY